MHGRRLDSSRPRSWHRQHHHVRLITRGQKHCRGVPPHLQDEPKRPGVIHDKQSNVDQVSAARVPRPIVDQRQSLLNRHRPDRRELQKSSPDHPELRQVRHGGCTHRIMVQLGPCKVLAIAGIRRCTPSHRRLLVLQDHQSDEAGEGSEGKEAARGRPRRLGRPGQHAELEAERQHEGPTRQARQQSPNDQTTAASRLRRRG